MKIIRPEYYDRFRCIAGACPISCCKDWEIDVDERSAAYYRSLTGELGELVRKGMKEEDGTVYMASVDGRCPMWRSDGLCRLQAELGEQALCRVCTDFPRLTHDYGDFTEKGLELSCPAAAELILSSPDPVFLTESLPGGEPGDYDPEAMESLKTSRKMALAIVNDPSAAPAEALIRLLMFGACAQEALDSGCEAEWDPAAAEETARTYAGDGDITAVRDFFAGLELLTQEWEEMLGHIHEPVFPEKARALAAYLIQRHWLQAVADFDLMCRVRFIAAACILVGALEGDYTRNACMFSREIENDAENIDALLDAAWTHPAFTDAALLGLLGANS